MSIHLAMSRGRPQPGHSEKLTTHRRLRWAAFFAALAIPAAALTAPLALASEAPPTTMSIDGNVPDNAAGQIKLPDEYGNVKELGPLNSNTTKIGVIHNDALPTLGMTNPNAQVDLRNAWLNTGKDTDGDDWIYFAWERDSNSGSGYIAFEFMANAAPSACKFDGSLTDQQLIDSCNPWTNRAAGDFMILWDQQGGSQDLWLRMWSDSNGVLTLGDPVAIPATWGDAAYSSDGYRGEAAINITQAIYGGTQKCLSFANIIPSTVTGNSDTADYKDTILTSGITLSNCTTTTTTTPKLADGTSNVPTDGTSITTAGVVEVKDSAYITLAGGSATPGGTIDFTLCKASNPANADCDTGTGAVSVLVGDNVAVSDTDNAYPVTVVSPSAWITAAGRYCWKADYTGVPSKGIGGSSDVSKGECFVVNPVTPTLTTSAGADVTLGTAVTDTATLTGTAPKPTSAVIETSAPSAATRTPAGGTIAFTLWGPSSTSCGSQVTAANASVTVSGDSSATNVYSTSYTPSAAGDYHWKASYSGDSPNTLDQSHNATCNDTNEDVTVGPASTTTVTAPRVGSTAITAPVAVGTSVTDHAVVTGTTAGGKPTGTVNFFICNPTEVTANGGTCSSGGTAAGSVTPLTPGTGNTSTADSNAVAANVVGTWCFRAVYVSDTANYTGSSDASTGECFTVKDTTSASSTQDWLPNDTATITATGGTALNGTLAFTLYSGNNCGATSGAALGYSKSFTLTNATSLADRTKTTDNSSVKVTSTSTVSWLVEFTSSDSLVGNSSHCEVTSLTITN